MKDFFLVTTFLVMVLASVVGAIFIPVYEIGKHQCAAYQSITSKPTKYAVMECYIQDDGKWYSEKEYKNRLVAKGTMK